MAVVIVNDALQMDSAFIVSAATHGKIIDDKDNGDQSYNKSIATDEGDEFDFAAIKGCTQAALNGQKTAHVFFELDKAAPKLEQLAAVLSGAHMSHLDLSRAVGFVEKLEKLKVELVQTIENDVSDSESGTTSLKGCSSKLCTSATQNISHKPTSIQHNHGTITREGFKATAVMWNTSTML